MTIYSSDETNTLETLKIAANESVETLNHMPESSLGFAFLKMIVSLVVVVSILFIALWLMKKFMLTRFQKGGASSSIHILESRMLSPKTTLYLIEVDQKKILVTESHLEIKRLESFIVDQS